MVMARVHRYCACGSTWSPGMVATVSTGVAPHVQCHRRYSGAVRNSGTSLTTSPTWRRSRAPVRAMATVLSDRTSTYIHSALGCAAGTGTKDPLWRVTRRGAAGTGDHRPWRGVAGAARFR